MPETPATRARHMQGIDDGMLDLIPPRRLVLQPGLTAEPASRTSLPSLSPLQPALDSAHRGTRTREALPSLPSFAGLTCKMGAGAAAGNLAGPRGGTEVRSARFKRRTLRSVASDSERDGPCPSYMVSIDRPATACSTRIQHA